MLDHIRQPTPCLFSLLEKAVEHRCRYARIDWLDPLESDLPAYCKIILNHNFLEQLALDGRSGPARTCIFDGRGDQPKFNASLWTADIGCDPVPVQYRATDHANPYQKYLWPILSRQTRPAKVATVVGKALNLAGKADRFDLPQLSDRSHECFFRWSLARMARVDPYFHFAPSNKDIPRHLDYRAKVLHLSVYDTKPLWCGLEGVSALLEGQPEKRPDTPTIHLLG